MCIDVYIMYTPIHIWMCILCVYYVYVYTYLKYTNEMFYLAGEFSFFIIK